MLWTYTTQVLIKVTDIAKNECYIHINLATVIGEDKEAGLPNIRGIFGIPPPWRFFKILPPGK